MRHCNAATRSFRCSRLSFLAVCVVGLLPALAGVGHAESARIVALGASNTVGYGAGGQGWTTQLESMLRAKGYDVSINVQGVVGDTSAGILQRVDSAVPPGTQIVIFDVGGGNDKDTGAAGQTAANRALIEQRIRARGAKAIYAPYASIVGSEAANKAAWRENDPHHHLTVQSHARVAAWLLPRVIAAIGKKN